MTMDPGGYLSTLQQDPNGSPGQTAGGVANGQPMGGLKPATAGQTKLAPPYLSHPSLASANEAMGPFIGQ